MFDTTNRSWISLAAASALVVGGLTLVGCDDGDEYEGDASAPAERVDAPDVGEESFNAADFAEKAGETAKAAVADVKKEIDEVMAGDGTAAEKMSSLLETGQERFASLSSSFSDDGDEATGSFFGSLNDKFDGLKEAVSSKNYTGLASQFSSLQNLEIPAAAKPYVEPYMESIKGLIPKLTSGNIGEAAGKLLGGGE